MAGAAAAGAIGGLVGGILAGGVGALPGAVLGAAVGAVAYNVDHVISDSPQGGGGGHAIIASFSAKSSRNTSTGLFSVW